jgi:hypothetical protein
VRGRGDHIDVAHRAGVGAARDQSGDVRDIGDQDRADLPGDLGEAGEVDGPGDGGAAAEDQLRALPEGQVPHLVQFGPPGVGTDAVLHAAEPRPGRRHPPAVRQMPAHRQGHAHDGVAGLEEGQVDGEVRGRARVGLDVGVLDAEQGLRPVDRQRLDPVDVLLALVVALPGVALGVLVLQHRAGRLQHGGGDVVLTGDQPQGVRLQLLLGRDQGGEFGVCLLKRAHGGPVLRVVHRMVTRVPRRTALRWGCSAAPSWSLPRAPVAASPA